MAGSLGSGAGEVNTAPPRRASDVSLAAGKLEMHTVFSPLGLAPYFPFLNGMCGKRAFINSGPPL